MTGQKRKKPGKTHGFWTAKSGKNPKKIGFGRVFSAVLEKIPFFRPKREHCPLGTPYRVLFRSRQTDRHTLTTHITSTGNPNLSESKPRLWPTIIKIFNIIVVDFLQGSTEYQRKFAWNDSYKSASFEPDYVQSADPAGVSSAQLGRSIKYRMGCMYH